MKQWVGLLVFLTVALLVIPFTGCDSNSLESRLVKASEVLPQNIAFENLYVDVESPKRSVVTSTISVSISEPEDFARDVVLDIFRNYRPEELKELASRPFIDLGIPKHETVIPDSLSDYYNAWLIGAAALAYSGKDIKSRLSFLASEDDFRVGSGNSAVQIEVDSSTIPTDYGDVIIAIHYDYDAAPKGLIIID